jgi:hypothetical protein
LALSRSDSVEFRVITIFLSAVPVAVDYFKKLQRESFKMKESDTFDLHAMPVEGWKSGQNCSVWKN